MEFRDTQDQVLSATLPHIVFEGWTDRALQAAVADLGLDPTMAERAFMGGPRDAVFHFLDMADRKMVEDFAQLDSATMKVPEKIRQLIRLRLIRWSADREAIRAAVSLLAMPQNALKAATATAKTIDVMWKAADDRSNDFSWYTRRATLIGIYSATLLYWLDDTSDDFEDTFAFLDRRLAGVGRFGKVKGQVKSVLDKLPLPHVLAPKGN